MLGQYAIYERLGRGGMATVSRAELRGLAGFRKPVAVKRLHPHVATDPAMVRSFLHEARLASHLHHPNVAQTYDLGKIDDSYFIAMEYIPGPTLAQILRQSADAAGPAPIPIALSILGQICDALDYAHNLCDDDGAPLGIIHRDISPSNILISSTGVVKLIDFGIARTADFDTTDDGLIKGKLSYMAPEYLEGQLDLRADLFGLGVIAHELLTGRPLFHADSDAETIQLLRELPIVPPSRWNAEVPEDLDDIVLTALQRRPEVRWQSAAAMRTAILNVRQSFGPVTNQQVIDWVEWAFRQESSKEAPREPSRGAPREPSRDASREPSRQDGGLDHLIDRAIEDEVEGAIAALLEPARGTLEPAVEEAGEPPAPPDERHAPRTEDEVATIAGACPIAAPRRRGALRAWLLMLLMLVLAALARERLADTGHALYAWYAD
jgi:eukaryotic-like serine/threonine-protein kinase